MKFGKWLKKFNLAKKELKALGLNLASATRLFCFRIAKGTKSIFRAVLGMVVYIAMIPVILQLLNSLVGSVSGTAGVLVSAIIAIVPLMLVIKVLDYLDF